MVDSQGMLGGVLIACALAIAGCTSGDNGITLDSARKTATSAGASPAACPIPFDVSAALPGGPAVRPGKVEVQASKTTTPAADPLAAQRDQGMTGLDAAAGVSFECDYEVEGKTIHTWLVVTPGPLSINLMAPQIAGDSGMPIAQLADFVANPPEPGKAKLTPGGEVAVGRVPVDGNGDASLFVNPDGVVTGDALNKTTESLLSQIRL